MKTIITAVASFALGIGVAGVLAEAGSPICEVTEINVKEQGAYEASGVDKVREGIAAAGGKIIAGGYNKATAKYGAPAGNRFLIIQYPSKEAADKHWTNVIMPWFDNAGHKYVDRFRENGLPKGLRW